AGQGTDLRRHPVGQLVPPALAQVKEVDVVVGGEIVTDVEGAEPGRLEDFRHLAVYREILRLDGRLQFVDVVPAIVRRQDERASARRGREARLEAPDQGGRRRVWSQVLPPSERGQVAGPEHHLTEPRGQDADDAPVLLGPGRAMRAIQTSEVG